MGQTNDINLQFESVENMLYGIAWFFTSRYLAFEDAKREAFYGYVKAAEKYDSERGMKFSSWIYYKVTRHMKTFVSSRCNDRLVFVEEIKEDALGPVEEVRDILKECIDQCYDLPEDAEEMISLLFDVDDFGQTPRRMIEQIKKALGFKRGLDRVERDIIFHELRMKFERS